MRVCKVQNLVENDILARAVMTEEYQILLSEGTVLKLEYIEKLVEFGIGEVYLEENRVYDVETIAVLKDETEGIIRNKVKHILETHTYQNNQELSELSQTADHIISNILEEEKVVEKILDIKERSADIYEHSISICTYATLMGLKLKLDEKLIHNIGVGCLLHDIGLRYLTIDYINRDMNEVDNIEKAEYRKHPVYGYSTVQDEEWLDEISKNIILYHHERLDGSGFPLKATVLSKEIQIVIICDIFDEMICGIGRERVKVYQAVEYLKTFQDVYFSKELVQIFLEFTAVYPNGSQVITNFGDLAIVVRQNNQFPERPVLLVIKDKEGKSAPKDTFINLLSMNSVFIETVLG